MFDQGQRIFDNMMTPRRPRRPPGGDLTMRMFFLMALAIGATLGLGAAQAQQPAPEYGAPISIDQAKENGWHMAVAVVDPGGYLIYFERMDGTQNASVRLAEAKARTSALFRR